MTFYYKADNNSLKENKTAATPGDSLEVKLCARVTTKWSK